MNTADIKNKDLPAFACVAISNNDGYQQDGLTKREYFTAKAMQALASNPDWVNSMRVPDDWDDFINRLAKGAVELADSVLQELERGTAAK